MYNLPPQIYHMNKHYGYINPQLLWVWKLKWQLIGRAHIFNWCWDANLIYLLINVHLFAIAPFFSWGEASFDHYNEQVITYTHKSNFTMSFCSPTSTEYRSVPVLFLKEMLVVQGKAVIGAVCIRFRLEEWKTDKQIGWKTKRNSKNLASINTSNGTKIQFYSFICTLLHGELINNLNEEPIVNLWTADFIPIISYQ